MSKMAAGSSNYLRSPIFTKPSHSAGFSFIMTLMKIYYSVMANKSYREDKWEIVEGCVEYSGDYFEFYLYEIILKDFARFTNLIARYEVS